MVFVNVVYLKQLDTLEETVVFRWYNPLFLSGFQMLEKGTGERE